MIALPVNRTVTRLQAEVIKILNHKYYILHPNISVTLKNPFLCYGENLMEIPFKYTSKMP
jgi:hypothetical protein